MKPVVLITGGNGLVGHAIKYHVENIESKDDKLEQFEYVFTDLPECNLMDREATDAMFEKLKPSYVIHCAARVGGLFQNMNFPVQMGADNMTMNNNVLAAAHKYGVKKLICLTSTCVFPAKVSYPIKEEYMLEGPPDNSNFAYAYAKRMLSIMCTAYNKQYGTKFVCLAPTNLYGPHDNFDMNAGHVLPGLVRRAVEAKEAGENFVVWGTGKPLRQFLFSRDLARILCTAVRYYGDHDSEMEEFEAEKVEDRVLLPKLMILTVPEKYELSIGDAARIVAKGITMNTLILSCLAAGLDPEKDLVFDTEKADGQFKKSVSSERVEAFMKRVTGSEFQFTTPEEGIGEMVKWYKETKERRGVEK